MNGTSRTPRDRREGDDIYQLHPIPSIPSHLSRPPRPSEDSMLAYTQRMRHISKVRADPAADEADSAPQTALEIQAQHIPKIAVGQVNHGNRRPLQRRPMSLDELTGRRGQKEEPSANNGLRPDRCMSEPVATSKSRDVSSKNDKQKDERRIRINFVSTADLFDLVDFSLRGKKSDYTHLTRAEDTLRLIREVKFFRSLNSRRRVKPWIEREPELDRASLVVQGTSSPRESSSVVGREEKEGDWATKELLNNVDFDDGDDEEEEDDNNNINLDIDLLQDKRRMLLQPPKLYFRPKRAKRMRMHRSLLSAIPEMEQTQRSITQLRLSEDMSVRRPIIPSSASLAAIKKSKQQPEASTSLDTGLKKPNDRLDYSIEKDDDDFRVSHSETVKHKENRVKKKKQRNRCVDSTESSSQSHTSQSASKEETDAHREGHSVSSKNKDSPGRAVPGLKGSSLKGRTVLLQPSDTHKKRIRKIIFLRDLPQQPSHRSTH
ncbi:hypothetical protein ACOMHN_033005 [Nucella lapillus]